MLLPDELPAFVRGASKSLLADPPLRVAASRCLMKFEGLDIPEVAKTSRDERRELAKVLVYGIYAIEAYATAEGRRASYRWYRRQSSLPQHPHWKRVNVERRKVHGGRGLSRIENLLLLGFFLRFGKEQASMPLLRPLAPVLYLMLHGRKEPNMTPAEDVYEQIRARINRLGKPRPIEEARDLFLTITDCVMKPF